MHAKGIDNPSELGWYYDNTVNDRGESASTTAREPRGSKIVDLSTSTDILKAQGVGGTILYYPTYAIRIPSSRQSPSLSNLVIIVIRTYSPYRTTTPVVLMFDRFDRFDPILAT